MRRLTIALTLLALFAIAPACRRKHHDVDDGKIKSSIKVGDPRAAVQLTRGFHKVENDSWRWTMRSFSISLLPPAGSATNGATLELKFTLPDAIFSQLGPMTLSARVAGNDLAPETYSKAGDYVYSRDIPASALKGDAVSIDFSTDKALAPTERDDRELAIIVVSAALIPK